MKHGLWTTALWILNVAAYLAIVGIAVGPALELPIRIAAVAAAVLYTLVVAIFWGKIDLALQVELAIVALGGLLAFSGWRLGSLGAANGASVLGVSGDVVGAGLLLAMLIGVMLSVLFAPRVPVVLRLLVALAIAYPCVPVAVALSHGGGLSQALASNAPLPRDPGWIRGAFLASMVVLPLATIATIVTAIVLAARKRFHGSSRALAAALALAVTAQMSGLEAANAGLPDTLALHGNAIAPAVAAAGAAAGAGGLAGAAGALGGGATASTAPGTTATSVANAASSAPAAAESTGATPLATASSDAASASGGLAGLGGAFNAIGGEAVEDLSNSKDRPRQRVGEFVRKLGIAQKYVRHEDFDPAALALTLPADANALDTFVRDSIGLDDYSGAMRGAKGTLMSRAGNDVDKALLLAELLKDRSISYRFATTTLSADDAKALEYATAVSPAAPSEDPPDAFYTEVGVTKERIARASATRAAAQKKYVDAMLAYAKPHAADLLNAVGAAQPPAADGADAPAFAAGATHTFVQANVGGTWIDLDPSLARLTPGTHLGGGAVQNAAALDRSQYRVARLRYITNFGGADQVAADRTVSVSDVSGTPLAIGASPDVAKLEDTANATAFTAFTSMGQDSQDGVKFGLKDAQGHALTGARIQIDVSGGGVPARTYTRILWSAGAPNAPLGLSRTYQLLIVPGGVGSSFDSSVTLATVIAAKALFLYTALPPNERTLPTQAELTPAYPLDLLHFIERDDMFSSVLSSAGSSPVRFTYDRPDIIMLANGFVRSGSEVRGTTAFDIVENGRRAVSSDPSAARLANVERGVLDTTIEAQVLSYLDKNGHGTPQAFAAAKTANIGATVVASAQTLPANVPARSAAPLRETLAHGQVAYALASPVTMSGETHYAWWAIDPKTGDTVGRMDDGAGVDLVENSAYVIWAKRASLAFTILGFIIGGPGSMEDAEIGIISGGVLGGTVAGSVINEVIGCLKTGYESSGGQYGAGGDGSSGGGDNGGGGGGSGAGSGSGNGDSGDGPPPFDGVVPNY